ncbi:phosphotransferase [Streptomyces sp. NPDC006482]|uniref:phosphotransferase n=1 Tax=Streptomyces sp. NPDC006482 TaxID=3154306 RepID=UPI0033AECEE3
MESELSDGWFSAVHRVRLDGGRHAVVALAPPDGAAVLRYERGILRTEAMVCRRIAGTPGSGVRSPELLYAHKEFVALSAVEGTAWDKASDRLTDPAEAAARRELGAITARLHTLAPEDGRFGYPAAPSGLSATGWRTAFTASARRSRLAKALSDPPHQASNRKSMSTMWNGACDDSTRC